MVSPREVVAEGRGAAPDRQLKTSRCLELWEDYVVQFFLIQKINIRNANKCILGNIKLFVSVRKIGG